MRVRRQLFFVVSIALTRLGLVCRNRIHLLENSATEVQLADYTVGLGGVKIICHTRTAVGNAVGKWHVKAYSDAT